MSVKSAVVCTIALAFYPAAEPATLRYAFESNAGLALHYQAPGYRRPAAQPTAQM